VTVFRALGRYCRALWYLVTGRIDSARKELSRSPHVVQATYDSIIREKTNRIQQYKDAVAAMIAQQEKKLGKIKRLSEEVARLESLKEGAAAKAKARIAELQSQGKSMEAIKHDEGYIKCLSAFNDFSSTLDEKREHIDENEGDVKGIGDNIKNHKIQLQQLLRDIDKLKEEASATVADMITAKEEEGISDMLSGISDDKYDKELQDLRDVRDQQKAKARISRELSGTDTARQEAEFLDYARDHSHTSEFEELIGLAKESDAPNPEAQSESRPQLPEQ
jgi:chromosome segregation ATPase